MKPLAAHTGFSKVEKQGKTGHGVGRDYVKNSYKLRKQRIQLRMDRGFEQKFHRRNPVANNYVLWMEKVNNQKRMK